MNKNSTNHHFTYSILVNNSNEKVWSFLINVERWKEWDTEITNSKLIGSFKLNAKGSFKPKGGPKLNFYISELVPKESYTFIAKMPFCSFEVRRILIPKEGLIEFTDEVQFTGPLKGIYRFMLKKRLNAALPIVLENFKRIAELE
jgi:hypothetical protein